MVTIIIPTANRPSMLRTALASVASQSAVEKIHRVFVSENGGDNQSKQVCAEFPALPIAYFQRAGTTPLQHMQILMRECLESELSAILHDDDWWSPSHLANAIDGLESHPEAAAYGASHFIVSGESSMLHCCGNLFPWFGASYPPFQAVWELSRSNVLMTQLLGTIAHYSSLVARTELLRKASFVFDLGNPFDNDRMLWSGLAGLGSAIFNPVPEVFVRRHGAQDCFAFNDQARIRHMCETTRWMVESSGKSWDQIANSFARRMALCPPEAAATLRELARQPWCMPELTRHSRTTPAPEKEVAAQPQFQEAGVSSSIVAIR